MTSLRPLKSASETLPPPSRGRLNAGAFAPTERSFAIQVPSFRPFFAVNRVSRYAGKVPSGRAFAWVRRPRQGDRFASVVVPTGVASQADVRERTLLSEPTVSRIAECAIGVRGDAKSGHGGS